MNNGDFTHSFIHADKGEIENVTFIQKIFLLWLEMLLKTWSAQVRDLFIWYIKVYFYLNYFKAKRLLYVLFIIKVASSKFDILARTALKGCKAVAT